jgi:hypothetical protein
MPTIVELSNNLVASEGRLASHVFFKEQNKRSKEVKSADRNFQEMIFKT